MVPWSYSFIHIYVDSFFIQNLFSIQLNHWNASNWIHDAIGCLSTIGEPKLKSYAAWEKLGSKSAMASSSSRVILKVKAHGPRHPSWSKKTRSNKTSSLYA